MTRMRRIALAAILNAAFAPLSAMANLVANSGFESNGSWETSEPPGVAGWSISNFGRGTHTGLASMGTGCLDPSFSCTFFQTLATTADSLYDISFWLYADGVFGIPGSSTPNGLQVTFDGAVVSAISNFPSTNPFTTLLPGGPSTLITINKVPARSNLAVLHFGGFHAPQGIFVDDVSVVTSNAVPEPASIALIGLLLAGLVCVRRTRQTK